MSFVRIPPSTRVEEKPPSSTRLDARRGSRTTLFGTGARRARAPHGRADAAGGSQATGARVVHEARRVRAVGQPRRRVEVAHAHAQQPDEREKLVTSLSNHRGSADVSIVVKRTLAVTFDYSGNATASQLLNKVTEAVCSGRNGCTVGRGGD